MQLSQVSNGSQEANQADPKFHLTENLEKTSIRQSPYSLRNRASRFSKRNNTHAMIPNRAQNLGNMMCNCHPAEESSTVSYAFNWWLLNFHFEQHIPFKHRRGCKYYGIHRKTPRVLRAEFPLMMWFFSARLTLASFDFTTGTSSSGISIRCKNVVPRSQSPVPGQIERLIKEIAFGDSVDETQEHFDSFERAILSLYRDRESSPNDRTEQGESHLTVRT